VRSETEYTFAGEFLRYLIREPHPLV
jgi:hypothetical protein